MATSSNVGASTNKSYYLRLQLLIIDCGTRVLLSLFDAYIPPPSLQTFLAQNQGVLQTLQSKRVIAKAQWEKLYPTTGKSRSDTYDLSLLKCLLRQFWSKRQAPVFKTQKPLPNDLTPAADVVRIGNHRNELAHKADPIMSKQDFETKWKDIEQILCRLGKSIPNLATYIKELKTTTLDTEREAWLQEKMKFLADIDKETQRNIREVGAKLDHLTTKMSELEVGQKEIQEKVSEGSPRFQTLSMCSQQQLQVSDSEHVFVKTEQYDVAKKRLDEKHIVVLSGHPGEGKTLMAKHLLNQCFSLDRCLILSTPNDWREFVPGRVDAILIDDIFGVQMNSTDKELLHMWLSYFSQIETLAKNGKLSVILTSRTTVLEKAIKSSYKLRKKYLFRKQNVVHLHSNTEEKMKILRAHLDNNSRDVSDNAISQCVNEWNLPTLPSFMFGFPKCAEMFARINELFEREAFFLKPTEFFLECMQKMKDELSFMALLLLWTSPNAELLLGNESPNIELILEKFGLIPVIPNISVYWLKIVEFLKQNENGYTVLNDTTGIVCFNHIVIGDCVGIVAGQIQEVACLEHCSLEFLMQYVTVQEKFKDSPIHVHILPFKFLALAKRLVSLLKDEVRESLPHSFLYMLDHNAFTDETFTKVFVEQLNGKCPECLFTEPIDTVEEDEFTKEGFVIPKMSVHAVTRCLADRPVSVFKELISQGLLAKYMGNKLDDELYICLLQAVNNRNLEAVEVLINSGCDISEEALLIAWNKGDFKMIDKMATKLTQTKKLYNRCTFKRDCNLMYMAVMSGPEKLVQQLAPYVDLSYRDAKGRSSVYICFLAMQYINHQHHFERLFQILVENGAPLNYKYERQEKTLLHFAVEQGMYNQVVLLLKKGADVSIKDRSGKCPIHCTAFSGDTGIAELLLRHDPHQAGLKLTTHSQNSQIKGMTFMHIAVWKKKIAFIQYIAPIINELLGELNTTDHYGRTALYCAVFYGYEEIVEHMCPISDVTKPEKNGFTPLHAAIHKGRPEIAKKLYAAGADLNASDKYGKTPLHVAAEMNDENSIYFFLEQGANHAMRTKRKTTAMDILYEKQLKGKIDTSASLRTLREWIRKEEGKGDMSRGFRLEK